MVRVFRLLLILAWVSSPAWSAPPLVGTAPGAAGRDLAQSMPAYRTPDDHRAANNARQRGTMIRIPDLSPNLELQPTYLMDVTVTCTTGVGTVTISPGVIPDVALFNVGTTYQVKIPQCGTASGILTANVSTISAAGASQTITLNAVTAATTFTGVVTVALGPQGGLTTTPSGANRATPLAAAYLQAGITFSAGSRTLTVPSGLFAAHDYTETGPGAFYATEISIPNAAGSGCNQPLVTAITALPTATTATLRDAPSCSVTGATGWLYWGPLVFGPADVGRHIELLGGGVSGAHLVTTIASYVDPAHVVLAANNNGAKASKTMAELTVGTDATAEFIAAAAAAVSAGHRYFYVPPGSAYFLATATAASMENAAAVVWCGPGDVFMPRSLKIGRTVARNCANAPATPWPGNTIVPGLNLRTSRAAVGPVIVIPLGDSQATRVYNDLAPTGFPDVLCGAIQRSNPGVEINCRNNLAIGGTIWAAFDPTGPDLGQGVGKPTTAPASLPTWYSPTSSQYWTFVQAACPHLIPVKWGFNDGYNLLPSAVEAFFSVTQGAAWKAACGYNPDVILVTEGGPGQAVAGGYTTPDSRRYSADFLRSIAARCAFRLANGGCPGVVDLARGRDLATYGYSTQDFVPERAAYVTPAAQPNQGPTITTTSYTWPSPTMDYGVQITAARRTAANPAAWWSGQTVRFSLGAGASGTPTSTTGNNGLALAPAGGELVLGYAAGTGNYTVRVSAWDVTSTATATGSGTTVTCAAACTNMAFKGYPIDIPGAGAAGATLTTKALAISADGRTITLADAIVTNFTAVSKALRFYWDVVQTTDTGVPARCAVVTTFCDSAFTFQRQGHNVRLYDGECFSCGPVWSGPVVLFGGYHTPTISFSAITSWRMANSAATNVPRVTHGRPENGTPYAPSLSDREMWGWAPSGAGRWAGGNWVHPSTHEAILDRVLQDIDWSLDVGGQTSAEVTPTTGFSYVIPASQTLTLFTPAGTLATGAVTLPAGVSENQMVQVTSTQQITSLTVTAPAGFTLVGAGVTTVPANGTIAYRRTGTKLVRVQ